MANKYNREISKEIIGGKKITERYGHHSRIRQGKYNLLLTATPAESVHHGDHN